MKRTRKFPFSRFWAISIAALTALTVAGCSSDAAGVEVGNYPVVEGVDPSWVSAIVERVPQQVKVIWNAAFWRISMFQIRSYKKHGLRSLNAHMSARLT